MHPILFTLGPLTIRGYGVMVAVGCALAIWLAWRQAQHEGIDSDKFLDLALWAVIGGILGGRLLYVLVTWQEFAHAPLDVFKIWQGGLVFYGAFLLSFAAILFYCWKYRLALWQVLDICAPYAALAHALGRIGCFLNGCCYGLPNATWGVIFPSLQDQIPRLPTQLYESAGDFLLFLLLLAWSRRRHFQGQIFWVYALLYACLRFGLEFIRGDEIRGTIGFAWLHTSQLIALLAVGVSLVMLIVLHRQAKRSR